MENVKIAKNNLKNRNILGLCHDCKKNIEIEGENIKNGVFLIYDDCGEKIKTLKCKNCYKKSKALGDFRRCEVYSRVVGYIRPVQQWNIGKKQEFGEREEYNLSA